MNRLITLCFTLLVCSLNYALKADTSDRENVFTKASISFRVGVSIWEAEEQFNTLLDLFDKYKGVTDEITFFVESVHTPITVELFDERVNILRDRIAQAKARGYRSGFNILCTIGHHPESLSTMIGSEYPRAVALNGHVAEGTLCMNQEIFRQRVQHIYSEMAQADPDYIWIDDDIRVGHWLTSSGEAGSICFCDTCMARIASRISQETGTDPVGLTREELAKRMDQYPIRKIVHDCQSDSINELFSLIEQTVHQIRPKIELGFMTGERYEEGYDFARWAKTLSGPNNTPVRWRPGGGFYTQTPVTDMVKKTHEIGRQVSLLPSCVTTIQSEIENFPYAPLQKSRHITALEAASHLAAGCTGAAFNVLTMNRESLASYEPLLAELQQWRPFYDKMVRYCQRFPAAGVFPLWGPRDGDNPMGNPINGMFPPLSEIGIPVAYSRGDSSVFLLARGYLATASKSEMQELLSRGIYTDVASLNAINDPNTLNLITLTGMEYQSEFSTDSVEEYLATAFNTGFVGTTRDQRQSFWRSAAYGLRLTNSNAISIAKLIDYAGNIKAESSMACFENELGGRLAVAGYYPWDYYQSLPKATQMKRLMRWLSKDRLCAWVDSYERGHLWVRVDESGSPQALVFLNATYDAAEKPVLMIRTESPSLCFHDRFGKEIHCEAVETDGPYRRFELPCVGPWELALISIP